MTTFITACRPHAAATRASRSSGLSRRGSGTTAQAQRALVASTMALHPACVRLAGRTTAVPRARPSHATSSLTRRRGCRVRASTDDQAPPAPGAPGPSDYVRAIVENVVRTAGHAPVIFLKLLDGSDRVLPVFIGEAEFSALQKELRQQTTLRPMTHDLMKSSMQAMGVTVTRVQVTEMRDNTFFARIFYAAPSGDVTDVDARPSDAINLAVRFGAPIYVAQTVAANSAYLMNGADYSPERAGATEGGGGGGARMGGAEVGGGGAGAPTEELVQAVQRQVVRRRDPALELRSRLAMAVAEEHYDDAVTLQEQIATVIGSHKVAALLHQMEIAVVEERYMDAARIRDELQALDAESVEREKMIFEEHE